MSQSHAFSQVMQMLACYCLEFLYASRLNSQGIFLLPFPRLLLCSNRLAVCVWIGLKKIHDSGRYGHGAEWRTSCSEREAGTAKKSRTGTKIWTTPLSLSLGIKYQH
jgi:hypothetical protein